MQPFPVRFRQFIHECTEDYLIRYANKGLYNRALKDMEKGITAEYTWTGQEQVQCILSDGTVCTLVDTLDQSACSCPSDKICRHILLGILYAQRHSTPVMQEEEQTEDREQEQHSPDFSNESGQSEAEFKWMMEIPLGELLRPYTTVQLAEMDFRLSIKETIHVTTDTLLTVSMESQQIEVSFTREPDLSKALCNVRDNASRIALYKLEAILRYRALKGLEEQQLLEESSYSVPTSSSVMTECRKLLTDISHTGLARLPQTVIARLETLAITARSEEFPNLERTLRSIRGELELFFARHIRFDMNALMNRLTETYLMLEVWEQELTASQRAQLVGSFRSRYYERAQLQLYALGAEPWETRSGYRGITYYLYCPEDGEMYTYTDARPVYYEGNTFRYDAQYTGRSPWRASLSMKQLAAGQWNFRHIRINRDRRISAAESTKIDMVERVPVEQIDFGHYRVEDPEFIHKQTEVVLFGEKKPRILLLTLTSVQHTVFDPSSQQLLIHATLQSGHQVTLVIPYHQEWQQTIRKLEKTNPDQMSRDMTVLVRADGQYLYPISFLKGTSIRHLKLDE
ncbi:hypothetical protein [Paenibacillus dauci]|uniref:hypothetical protein n=1 Tax=Paenibacillus dauci TaxID=1567106 RepID=UPI0006191A71|nr:hypothetical protein [Paenibacillus dauci]